MPPPLIVATVLGLLTLIPLWVWLWRGLRDTTLRTAWWWGIAGWLMWLAAWGFTALWGDSRPGLVDQVWYATAIVLLCPPIAVLGARRPTSRVWGLFVLLPLLLVLGWPIASGWGRRFHEVPWVVEEPVFVGYGLVLVMGLGNYLGTRYRWPAVLIGIALLLLVLPLFAPAAGLLPAPTARLLATGLFIAACWLGVLLTRSGGAAAVQVDTSESRAAEHDERTQLAAFEQLWRDFRDHFGIVWTRRIQDRFNATAEKSRWPFRLDAAGTVAPNSTNAPPTLSPEVASAAEAALRWLLRRFVDPIWIDRRLGHAPPPSPHTTPIAPPLMQVYD